MSFHALVAHSYLLLNNILWSRLYHSSIIHSAIGGHPGCLYALEAMNKSCIKICVQVCVWMIVFNFFEQIPRRVFAGSYGKCMFRFVRKY